MTFSSSEKSIDRTWHELTIETYKMPTLDTLLSSFLSCWDQIQGLVFAGKFSTNALPQPLHHGLLMQLVRSKEQVAVQMALLNDSSV